MLSTQTQLALAGVTGGLFLAYCVYFDHKRRSAPDFKKKLRAKREQQQREKELRNAPKYPNFRNEAEVQKYFFEEIQAGEDFLARGEVNDGVLHLANAVAASGQPMQLLNLLKQSLPPEVAKAVAEKYPVVARAMLAASGVPVIGMQSSSSSALSTEGITKAQTLKDDDDLE